MSNLNRKPNDAVRDAEFFEHSGFDRKRRVEFGVVSILWAIFVCQTAILIILIGLFVA